MNRIEHSTITAMNNADKIEFQPEKMHIRKHAFP